MLNIKYLFLIFLFSAFIFLGSTKAQVSTLKIDSLLSNFYKVENPGISILISKKGEVIYTNSIGKANLKSNIPVSNNTVFQIGSITKQFTAIAILLLEEQGKLKLIDPITKYLPEYPTKGNNITIHSLLNHTSGIRSKTQLGNPKLRGKDFTLDETISYSKKFSLKFKSGERFSYSNSGYLLLGKIIEIVSGSTYQEFIQENILDKLTMNNTSFGISSEKQKTLAKGYQFNGFEYIKSPQVSISSQYSAGALLSTVNDLFKWQKALTLNKLVKNETYKKATKKTLLQNGQQIPYGYGWFIRKINNSIAFVHGGATPGFMSNGIYLTQEDVYIIALTNCFCKTTKNIQKITLDIAKLYANSKNSEHNDLKLSNRELVKWIGRYKLSNDLILTFKVINKNLFVSNNKKPNLKHKLISISKNEFTFENKKFRFLFSENETKKHKVSMFSGAKSLTGILIKGK